MRGFLKGSDESKENITGGKKMKSDNISHTLPADASTRERLNPYKRKQRKRRLTVRVKRKVAHINLLKRKRKNRITFIKRRG